MIEKRLNIVHTESSCGWGGQEIRILTESQGMLDRGHSIHLLCVEGSNIHREAIRKGIPVTVLPIASKNVKGILALRKWLKENNVDVVNTHSSTDSWLVALARIGLNIPVVRTRHVSSPISLNFATRWLYTHGCDFVVTTGERLRQHVIERVHLATDRVQSIPTGIDTALFIPGDKVVARLGLSLPMNKKIIGIVATLRTWKGHIYLIEAIAKLQRDDVLLLIVGDGPNFSNIKAAVEYYQLTEDVIFSGQQQNVVPWLQAMDIFVLPSYANEGVPQSLMQAMACGIPVVSTAVGSIDEIINNNVTGLIVPAKNGLALKNALEGLLNNSDKREMLANAARNFSVSECSLQKMLRDMSQVFEKCISVNN